MIMLHGKLRFQVDQAVYSATGGGGRQAVHADALCKITSE
jgi:hypothetical protein